jgi:hypothetical protein
MADPVLLCRVGALLDELFAELMPVEENGDLQRQPTLKAMSGIGRELIELRSAHAIDQNCGLCMISNDQINELVAAFRPITALADRLNG